jgi:N-acetylmuramoyl-L-alanine amidase CwlA
VNRNSISVELCDTVRNGRYGFTEKTLENAAALCRMLVEKYKIKPENIIRHFDVTGKNCPAPFVSDERAWEEFKERIVGEMVEKGTVIVDGKEHEVSMIRKDGVTYIKTRDMANLVGYQIGNKGKTPVFTRKG